MEYRVLGRTNLRVSALGFGCGNVGGLMIRGTRAERERAVARALELGVNFFDTAPLYGDGVSEDHLGEALQALKAQCLVATKVRLGADGLSDPAKAVTRSLETSLRRLRRDRVDLLQLHDPVRVARADGEPGADEVLDRILPAFETLRQAGKIGFVGMTAIGDTPAVHRVLAAGAVDSAQVCFNLLNPSAGFAVPPRFPGQDFARVLARTREQRMGVVVIRVLAGGALSGELARHPIAVPTVDPIASGPDYATDVGRARALPGTGRGRPRGEPGRGGAALPARLGCGVDGAPRLLEPRAPRWRRDRRGEGAAVPRGSRSSRDLLDGDGARALTTPRNGKPVPQPSRLQSSSSTSCG